MQKRKYLLIVLVFLSFLFLITSPSFGNGFIIGEQDAEAMGGASAFAARANNPSAIFYNPAGISQLDGINVTLGTNLITVKTIYHKPGDGDKSATKDRVDTPSYFYLTGKINESLSAGFGVYSPYGLASDWQSNWPGRNIVTYAMLRTFFFNPVIAWKPVKNLSIAAGAIAVYSDVVLNSRIVYEKMAEAQGLKIIPPGALSGVEGHTKLTGDGEGAGFNLGVLCNITDDLRLGVSYRSPVRVKYSGKAEFRHANSNIHPIVAIVNASTIDSWAKTKITMPAQLLAGISYNALKDFTLEFDLDWREWSSFDALRISFKDNRMNTIKIRERWKDTITYRAGLEYRLNDALALRAGYAYDPSAIKNRYLDPLVPDADKHAVTLGAGYKFGNWKLDISNMALFFETASTHSSRVGFNNMFRFNAKYNTFANITSLSVSYKF